MPARLSLALLFAALCSACTTSHPPAMTVHHPAPARLSQVDALVRQHLGADFDGVVLLQRGQHDTLATRTYGRARAAPDQAAHALTRYQVGSISKWITSVAVLRLVDQGKLALDVPIGRYLSGMPEHSGERVTLRHLLSNSAGIPNGVMQAYRADKSIADLTLSHAAAARRFATGAPLFAPGSGWEYSPTTWVVVAAVMEQATGEPFAQLIERLVLQPAGAHDSGVPAAPFGTLPAAALAYKSAAMTELNVTPHIVYVAASGTVYSTAADLARLAHAVYETGMLSPASKRELSTIVVAGEQYALGGRVRQLALGGQTRSVAWETGASGGYRSVLAHVPGEQRTVVILNNTERPQGQMGAAAEALLGAMYGAPGQ